MALGKLFGGTRGVACWLGRRPHVAAGIAAGVLYLLLPAVVGLDYRLLAQRGQYQLMWLNLLGAHYRPPIDTPKPLHVLLVGLLGSGPALYAVTCVMVGLSVAAAIRLGRAITGSNWPGLLAAVTVFALRGECIYYVLIGGTEPFPTWRSFCCRSSLLPTVACDWPPSRSSLPVWKDLKHGRSRLFHYWPRW